MESELLELAGYIYEDPEMIVEEANESWILNDAISYVGNLLNRNDQLLNEVDAMNKKKVGKIEILFDEEEIGLILASMKNQKGMYEKSGDKNRIDRSEKIIEKLREGKVS
jgi:glutamine synthetase type III